MEPERAGCSAGCGAPEKLLTPKTRATGLVDQRQLRAFMVARDRGGWGAGSRIGLLGGEVL